LNDFLSLSHLEEGRIQIHNSEINLETLFQEVDGSLQSLLKNGQKIITKFDGVKKDILQSETILRNILFNLISNGIKYSNEDILCHVSYTENHFQIRISDQGIGIPENDQKHVFTRFFRADNVVNIQGTGLGLSIVYKYIEIIGGYIRFESIQGEGTTFFLEIPLNNKDS
jgi:signal transduction histidine kinase